MRAVENTCMQKLTDIKDLTEGDWILQEVVVENKIIVKRKEIGGIRQEQIDELLRLNKHHKLNKILIRVGIPLVPSFCIAWIITLWFGNLLWLL
jgi:hypothetical protein